MANNNYQTIGDFLRRKRESLAPETVGLPTPARSRTPGLRREDVADLAGLSTVWYSKIERGKANGISDITLAALSDALRLDASEKKYIKTLVTQQHYIPSEPCLEISPQTSRLLNQLDPMPAIVINDYFDILACNQSYTRMCGVDINALSKEERNYVYLMITHPEWQRFLQINDSNALDINLQRVAALLRTMSASRTDDYILKQRVERFQSISEAFGDFWNEKSVRYCNEAEFEFLHAELGLISFKKQIWWNFSDNTCGRLVVYHAQSEENYQSLAGILN
ncbi:DNA-binding protein [Photobacterium angustum]|uniref:XRE family transcriptional regulator n=1 Tax=Photobacterium angustum TaxID=661 RepID=A0ABX5H518_PHOAN|nr:helix-turn-helix transcriptional regulator [Photobacterium angustum]KJG36197.1 DNA-binding protein [Photobacterium angustum]PSX10907.1 XRE family transcriptional regulator [Photobacterium angustum]